MATIVRDLQNEKRYVLIGVGYGLARTARPHVLFAPATTSTSSEAQMVAVADASGEISWLPSQRVSVVSVDGQSCRELLDQATDSRGLS